MSSVCRFAVRCLTRPGACGSKSTSAASSLFCRAGDRRHVAAAARDRTKLTLYYWPFAGRAQAIRDAFNIGVCVRVRVRVCAVFFFRARACVTSRAAPRRSPGKIPFENNTTQKFDEWKVNGELPLGQWPALVSRGAARLRRSSR